MTVGGRTQSALPLFPGSQCTGRRGLIFKSAGTRITGLFLSCDRTVCGTGLERFFLSDLLCTVLPPEDLNCCIDFKQRSTISRNDSDSNKAFQGAGTCGLACTVQVTCWGNTVSVAVTVKMKGDSVGCKAVRSKFSHHVIKCWL